MCCVLYVVSNCDKAAATTAAPTTAMATATATVTATTTTTTMATKATTRQRDPNGSSLYCPGIQDVTESLPSWKGNAQAVQQRCVGIGGVRWA